MTPVLELDATLTMLIVATLIPLLVGIVTKLGTHPAVKSIALIVLTTAASVLVVSTQADGVAVVSKATAITAIQSIVTAVATYFGVWRATGVSETLNTKTANFGI